jgi:hypothetical protein
MTAKTVRKAFLFLLVPVVVYVFSIGPAYRLLSTGRMQQQTFSIIYCPIVVLADNNRSAERILYWYLEHWYSDADDLMRRIDDEMTTK